ncbi:MAG: transposase [Actinomycetota bacterium]|nr:transposase [Actinomycetota bacterium]
MGDDAPELPDKPRRRIFTAEYKLRIVAEYDACVGDGDKGALLRREGLYSSHIVEWRRARDNAAVAGLAGPRRAKANPDTAALAKATKRIERLEEDLKKHKLALDIAGKAHALLEMLAESANDDTPASTEAARRPKR